jgi:hypothetical protein
VRAFCVRCARWKRRQGFHANTRTHNGLSCWCRECKREYDRERYGVLKRLGRVA